MENEEDVDEKLSENYKIDELAFLHDTPPKKTKQHKIPKVFPIAGAVADVKYKK